MIDLCDQCMLQSLRTVRQTLVRLNAMYIPNYICLHYIAEGLYPNDAYQT